MTGADGEGLDLAHDRAPTILVVEDEFHIRIAICAYLQDCGFMILASATADDAVAILEQGTEKIDLIFSDIRMPGRLDGLGLARWVCQYKPSVPVILTTGDAGIVDASYALGAAQTVFAKPYDPNLVVTKIRDTLGRRPLSMR